MELLSPAGNLQSAYSAFKGGADAIYIGGKQFSARANADNFSNEDIKEIVFFAHSIGKKVYVTLNTLLFQDEFFLAVEFAKFLYEINVDGVIIQDLGLANYLHKTLPDLPLNASTQLNCHNIRQAEALVKLGFKRIVLARETNLEFAKQVKALGVEVEVFGHGALCVSYSGNCLLSSFIGDRSGNRGRCAQPCRMRYDLLENGRVIDNSSFAISTKDLMTIDYLDKFIEAGVDSLKIEGRLKSNEYIYTVSKAYRAAIDAALQHNKSNTNEQNKLDLKKIFNRQFTKGYVLNESPFKVLNTSTSSHQGEVIGKVVRINKNRVSILLNKPLHRLDGIRFNGKEQIGLEVQKMFLKGNPVEEANKNQIIELSGIENANKLKDLEVIKTKDYLLNKTIEQELKQEIKVKIVGSFYARINEPITLTLSFNGSTVKVTGPKAQQAEGNGTSEDRIIDQLKKSGSYPYCFEFIDINIERCFIPISLLNQLRNEGFEALKNTLIKTNVSSPKEYVSNVNIQQNIERNVGISENIGQLEAFDQYGIEAFADFDKTYKNHARVTKENVFNKPNEMVHFPIINKDNNYLIASAYCNITNSYALDTYYELGFKECILSSECDFESIKLMLEDYRNRHYNNANVGLVMYGKLDMMIMRSCPIGTHYHNETIKCNRCHINKYELNDRTSEKYTLLGDEYCNIRVLNNRPLYLFDRIDDFNSLGIQNRYILLTDESKEKAEELITCLLENNIEFERFKHTRGHYQKRPL